MKSYKDLEIFKISKELGTRIHHMTMGLPKFELYEEGSQVRRSAKAVATLIVEGYGRRRYKAEYLRYLVCAHSECDETIVHLDYLFETGSLKDEKIYKDFVSEFEILSKKLYTFIQWVEDHFDPGNRKDL